MAHMLARLKDGKIEDVKAVLHKPLGIMIRQDSINIPNIAEVQYIVKFPFGNLARTSFGMQGTVKNCKKSLFRKECKSL